MTRDKDKGIRILCAVLFLAFAFCWFRFFQGDLTVAALAFVSHGTLSFPRLPAALILTVLSYLPVLLSEKVFKFRAGQYAANYVPSALILGALSGFDGSRLFPQSAAQWIAAAVICLVILLVCKVLSMIRRSPMDSPSRRFAGTLVIMLILMITAVQLGNTDENLHRRLMIERLVTDGKYDKALSVGRFEEESDVSIAWLRAQAMLQTETESGVDGSAIGEMLFAYPVPDAKDLALRLKKSENGNAQLAAYLLERDIDAFVGAIGSDSASLNLSSWQNDALPMYYMQAVVIASSIGYDISDAAQLLYPDQFRQEKSAYEAFCRQLDPLKSETRQYAANSLFIDYHETYYWFYEFSTLRH